MSSLKYIANVRLPTEKAHGLQIMKTCEALARQGVEVELLIPNRHNPFKEDPFDFYRVDRIFKIKCLPCVDFISLNIFGSVGYWLEIWTFVRSLKKYLKSSKSSIYYTRDLPIIFWLAKFFQPFFYEIHTLPVKPDRRYRLAWQESAGIIVISDGLKNALIKQGVDHKKILVARDAVDISQFKLVEKKEVSRQLLNLPLDQKIILYSGHLYGWKGVDVLAKAAPHLPADCHIYIVGGTEDDVCQFRAKHKATNLHVQGWQPPEHIPQWLNAANVLVVPTSDQTSIGANFSSPLKLFEYMAAERPIVASDLPALREIVDENSVFFFEAGNSAFLVKVLKKVLGDSGEAKKRSKHAYDLVAKNYTWAVRARMIREFVALFSADFMDKMRRK